MTAVFVRHSKPCSYSGAVLETATDIDEWLWSEASEGARLVTVCAFMVKEIHTRYENNEPKEEDVIRWTNWVLTEREAAPREVNWEYRIEKFWRDETGPKQLTAATRQGFQPLYACTTMEPRKLSLGVRVPWKTVVLERGKGAQLPPQGNESFTVNTFSLKTLEKEINDLAKKGWRVDRLSTNLNFAFLTKADAKVQRTYYLKKLPLNESKFLIAFREAFDEAKRGNQSYVGMVGSRADAIVFYEEKDQSRQVSALDFKLISFTESRAAPSSFATSRLREMQILLESAIVEGFELRDLVVAQNTKIFVMVRAQ